MKSGYIGKLAPQCIVFLGKFGNRIHALMDRPALPVPVLVGLHLGEVGVPANALIHALLLAYRGGRGNIPIDIYG